MYGSKGTKVILIAEDDLDILQALSSIFQDEGYEVRQVSDGLKIITETKKILPDIILLDVVMPDVDGREICRELKKDILVGHIPIVLMSANNNIEVMAREVCAEDFITKPFDLVVLLRKIKHILHK